MPENVVLLSSCSASEMLDELREEAIALGLIWLDYPPEVRLAELVRVGLGRLRGQDGVLLLGATCRLPQGVIGRLVAHAAARGNAATISPALLGGPSGWPATVPAELPLTVYANAAASSGGIDSLRHGAGSCLYISRHCLADKQQLPRSFELEDGGACWLMPEQPSALHLLAWDCVVEDGGGAGYPHVDWAATGAGGGRLALILEAMRCSGLPILLQVLHGIGGGVERHVLELEALLAGRACCLIMRPLSQAEGVRISLGGDDIGFHLPAEQDQLVEFLEVLELDAIHIHHALGFPAQVWAVLDRLGVPLDMTLHDYSIIQGSPTLTDRQGQFIGHDRPAADYEMIVPAVAEALRKLAQGARRLIVPSQDMRDRLAEALPELAWQVHPHPDRECLAGYPSPVQSVLAPGEPLHVLCIGALGREKGVEVLRAVANRVLQSGLSIRFTLLGDSHIPLGRAVHISGRYREEELAELILHSGAHVAWFPVQWPETWSYTLSAALETAMPILSSDLGAVSERVAGRPLTWLVDHRSTVEDWLAKLDEIHARLARPSADVQWPQLPSGAFYRDAYLCQVACQRSKRSEVMPSQLYCGRIMPPASAARLGWRSRLLQMLLAARRWPLVAALLAHVPYNLQRRLKRMLSVSPLGGQ